LFRWDGSTLQTITTGHGKLGSHLAWTNEGIWAAAPLLNSGEGGIFLGDGSSRPTSKTGTGIALTSTGGGAYAWANGWTMADGTSGNTTGRPTSIHINAEGTVGTGMARGAHYFSTEGQDLARMKVGDEAGFALASGDVNGDGSPEWLIGAPGTNTVVALDANTYQEVAHWEGAGRFGHSIAVCPNADNNTQYLLIGAPLSGTTGTVHVYTDLVEAETTRWTGRESDTLLGTTLNCRPDGFLAGAPGDAHHAGAVLSVQGFIPPSP